ncbi:MAG: DUF3524 domain-containing protein [Exilibacterium sp.]
MNFKVYENLLLSAYDVDSHKRWRQGLMRAFQQHSWTVLCLPPRHFRWPSKLNRRQQLS